jgi:hypothetical protein
MKIFKYPVEIADHSLVQMPKGAQILSVQTQHGLPQMWALVDPKAKLVSRCFFLRGTGHQMGEAEGYTFIGSFQTDGGSLVFHLFDGGEV